MPGISFLDRWIYLSRQMGYEASLSDYDRGYAEGYDQGFQSDHEAFRLIFLPTLIHVWDWRTKSEKGEDVYFGENIDRVFEYYFQ